MKNLRHEKILELIALHDVETQEELIRLLRGEGFSVTQATVSRDIRELHLVKAASPEGRPIYRSYQNGSGGRPGKFDRVFNDGVVSIATAQNILVIRTEAGMAMAVAAALDAMELPQIVGSIAGDDTIMCAIGSAKEAEQLQKDLLAGMGKPQTDA